MNLFVQIYQPTLLADEQALYLCPPKPSAPGLPDLVPPPPQILSPRSLTTADAGSKSQAAGSRQPAFQPDKLTRKGTKAKQD